MKKNGRKTGGVEGRKEEHHLCKYKVREKETKRQTGSNTGRKVKKETTATFRINKKQNMVTQH